MSDNVHVFVRKNNINEKCARVFIEICGHEFLFHKKGTSYGFLPLDEATKHARDFASELGVGIEFGEEPLVKYI